MPSRIDEAGHTKASIHPAVADPGGAGCPDPPPFLGHDVGFLTLGPKLDPLLDPPPFLLVDLRWTPVADPGCVCDRDDHLHPL